MNTPQQMQNFEIAITEYGRYLLEYAPKGNAPLFSFEGWTKKLLDHMMAQEDFRIAALRFTDVAPTLQTTKDLMAHLQAYFNPIGGGVEAFLDSKLASNSLVGAVIAPFIRQNIRQMASGFIAGQTVKESLKTLEKLHKEGVACSVDLLGEAVISKQEAQTFTQAYHEAIEDLAIATKKWPKPHYPEHDQIGAIARANISVKLSALYEHTNPTAHEHSVEVLTKRLATLLQKAKKHNVCVHIDMEQYALLPITLDVFRRTLLDKRFKDYPHLGIVCQAYLKESKTFLQTLIALAQERGTPFAIRLVKGAYWDYEQAHAEQMGWPCPVFDQKEETDIQYEALLKILLEAYPLVRPLIGSHNARSIAVAMALQDALGLENADIEFQVLNGMAPTLRDALHEKGYRVRQYCPIGAFIPGMSYLVRRLLENTANQSFLVQKDQKNTDYKTLLAPPVVPPLKEKPNLSFKNHSLRDFSQAGHRHSAQDALADIAKNLPQKVLPIINGIPLTPNSTHQTAQQQCPWHTETTVTHAALANTEDAENAITAAKNTQKEWQDLGFDHRATCLEKAATILEKNWQNLFALQVYEAGKHWHEADADIAEAIDFLRFYAQETRTLEGRFQPQSLWGEENTLHYTPKGIALVIAPWNFPLAISTGMVAANLVAGNPVIYKPAEQTTAIGLQMYQALVEAGVPVGALQFLPAKGAEVGAYLTQHKDVNMITFTGSKTVGLQILEHAGKTPENQKHVKKCVIEMGGKNTTIIDSDADLDEAVPGVVQSAFGFQGQKCSATSRVIVIGTAYNTFKERLKEVVSGLAIGPATDPANHINAVIDEGAYAKIKEYIALGKKEGSLLAQAKMLEEVGHFIPPTVFCDLPPQSRLIHEEIFGPVLVIEQAQTLEEAIKMALNSDYRLTGAFYSRNPEAIAYARAHFCVGNLYINKGSTGAVVARQPFGGGALSGTGTKAGGHDYLLQFVEPRTITENTMRRGFAPPLKETI